MNLRPARLTAAPLALLVAAAPLAPGEPDGGAPRDYVRISETDDATTLEVAEIQLTHPDGTIVDLIGALHIADAAYYDALNERFKSYDAVLFELVGGDGDLAAKLEKDPDKNNPIRFFQVLLKKALDLDFQMDRIDYTAPNFVHADMTAEEFAASQEEKGESFQSLITQLLQKQLEAPAEGEGSPDLSAFFALFSNDADPNVLKIDIARQLSGAVGLLTGLDKEGGASVILSGRNATALRKINEMREAGKTRLAVFYGAAHLPGMEEALVGNHGFHRDAERWNAAWQMTNPPTAEDSPAHPQDPEPPEEPAAPPEPGEDHIKKAA